MTRKHYYPSNTAVVWVVFGGVAAFLLAVLGAGFVLGLMVCS